MPSINKVATTLSKLQNSSAILPVALVETTVIAGRSYQGYKRGGKDELRERLIEETSSAVVWLFGIVGLNKVGDFIGKKCLNLKDLSTDVGKDVLRNPAFDMNKKTAIFKFSKIALSTILATGFVGFVLPKLNQSITKKVKQKEQQEQMNNMLPVVNMDSFKSDLKANNQKNNFAFKGAGAMNFLLSASHNLENNNVCRLLTTDIGITTGRVANSRNKYEAREYLFRDVCATYFYMFARKNVMDGLFKVTNTPKVHPEAILEIQEHLMKKVKGDKISAADFSNKTLNKTMNQEILSKIPFENDVVKLDDLKDILDEKTFEKAAKMSKIQPLLEHNAVLSKQQIEDVLSNNWLSDPEFLCKVAKKATWGLSDKPDKFVSKSVIEKARHSIDEFTQGLIKYAGEKQIDSELIEKFTKRNMKLNTAFTIAGFATSIFGLSFLIPKVQQYITYKATGKNAFPGTQNYS